MSTNHVAAQSQSPLHPPPMPPQLDTTTRPRTPDFPDDMEIDAEGNVRRVHGPITSTAEIDNTINHPGSVRINVKGAFIVDSMSTPPSETSTTAGGSSPTRGSPTRGETKGIRLPNHTAVVSHVAVDVSALTHVLIQSRGGIGNRRLVSAAPASGRQGYSSQGN